MQKVLTKREKILFFATAGVIAGALLVHFVVIPALTTSNVLDKEISVARRKLAKYHWLIAQKGTLETKYNEIAALLKASAASNDAQVTVLSALEALAKNANILIVDVRPQTANTNALPYKEIIIELRTEGTMEGYLKFIYDLEHSLSLLHIQKIRLTAKANAQILDGSFTISQPNLD
ncbi:MAG: GspMb/PilO family protein [Candidatus Omnitrophica bacterium]|nr:GspMb/PilO family protein [Candidatus Omnitrophota bacterium]